MKDDKDPAVSGFSDETQALHGRDRPRLSRLKSLLSPMDFINRLKHLNGDPHDVALGMAIGVFIGVTPTIPLHTILAVLLAWMFKASKPAAMIGVWVSNPLTIPIFYIGSYKVGAFILGNDLPFDLKYDSIVELAKVGLDVTLAMQLGGVVIGIPPAIVFYYLTRRLMIEVRAKMTLP